MLARIRPSAPRDAPDLARLHVAAMGTSLWASLGPRFLTVLYEGLLPDASFRSWVYEEDGRVRGFIAGTTDGRGLLRRAARRRGLALLRPAVSGLVRHPGRLWPLLGTPRYFTASGDDDLPESLFCSVEPDLRGNKVAGHLNKILFDELRAGGATAVKISTESDNEAAVRQLRSWGFAERRRFHFYGKPMTTFVLDLTTSPRVEPVSWEARRARSGT